MKKSVCLSQDSNLGSQIYLYGLIQPIRGRNRVNFFEVVFSNDIFLHICRWKSFAISHFVIIEELDSQGHQRQGYQCVEQPEKKMLFY